MPFPSMAACRTALFACALLLLAGCKTMLHSNLEEREANVIVALLQNAGLSASKEIDARSNLASVYVEESQFSRAIEILEANGLPQRNFATVDQIFSGGGIVSSPLEERARLNYAISQELSQSISQLDGVLSARVHVVLPEEGLLQQNTEDTAQPARASVLIRRRADTTIENLVPNVKRFVSSSINNLDYEDVAVIDFVVPQESMAAYTEDASALDAPVQNSGPFLYVLAVVVFVVFSAATIALRFGLLSVRSRREADVGLPERNVRQSEQ